jgi:hypothetical protein
MMSGMPRNRHRLPIDLARLRAPRSLGLTVAWRAGRRLDAGDIRMSESVADHLRSAVTTTLARVRESDLRPYGPDMHLETEEVLYVNDADLVSASGLGDVLFPDQPLQTISARTLPERPLVLYAVTFESAGEPVAFVRKTNPRKSAAAGRMLALLGNTLTGADKPVFTLDPSFDLIVTPGASSRLTRASSSFCSRRPMRSWRRSPAGSRPSPRTCRSRATARHSSRRRR